MPGRELLTDSPLPKNLQNWASLFFQTSPLILLLGSFLPFVASDPSPLLSSEKLPIASLSLEVHVRVDSP